MKYLRLAVFQVLLTLMWMFCAYVFWNYAVVYAFIEALPVTWIQAFVIGAGITTLKGSNGIQTRIHIQSKNSF